MVPDVKVPPLLQSLQLIHPYNGGRLFLLGTPGVVVPGWEGWESRDDCHLRTHFPVITAALQILHICLALRSTAPLLPKPPSSLPSSHVSTPPSGSSKYFPSLLFEASMGHGTSCTNHAALPWGGWSKRTGGSQMHRNPICTVFIKSYFSCQGSHHQSAAGSKQRV